MNKKILFTEGQSTNRPMLITLQSDRSSRNDETQEFMQSSQVDGETIQNNISINDYVNHPAFDNKQSLDNIKITEILNKSPSKTIMKSPFSLAKKVSIGFTKKLTSSFKLQQYNLEVVGDQNINNFHNISIDKLRQSNYTQTNFMFSWTNIYYSIEIIDNQTKVKKQRVLIDNNTGYTKSGELLAIMGPSGGGKSSLLNFLTDNIEFPNKSLHSGNVFINSERINFKKISQISGYVMQDDILFDILTPKETLLFVSKLRNNLSKEEHVKLVEDLLSELKLVNCQHTTIGSTAVKGISGGEKKRVSIGIEIISNPTIMFLDEPTSGLDSQTSFTIIDYLRNLALTKNKAIIFTIHQPSSNIYGLFDRLMLINKGQTVYHGNANGIIAHFENVGFPLKLKANPADAFMHKLEEHNEKQDTILMDKYKEIISPVIANEIEEALLAKELFFNIPKKNSQTATFIIAFNLLLQRCWLNVIRNPSILKMRIIFTLIYAFITASIFYNLGYDESGIKDREGFFFFFAVNTFMAGVFQAIIAFPIERGVFLREHTSKLYDVLPYYLAKNIIETPFSLLIHLVYCLIVYYLINLRENVNNYFIFCGIYLSLSWLAQSFGFMFGAAFENLSIGIVITQFSIMPFFLFSGFLINQVNMPVWLAWIRFLSPFRFTIEAALRNEMDENLLVADDFNSVNALNLNFGMNTCVIVLLVYGLTLRIIGFFILKSLIRKIG